MHSATLKSFRGDAKFSTWLVTIAMNEGASGCAKRRAFNWNRWMKRRKIAKAILRRGADGLAEIPSEALEKKETRQNCGRPWNNCRHLTASAGAAGP